MNILALLTIMEDCNHQLKNLYTFVNINSNDYLLFFEIIIDLDSYLTYTFINSIFILIDILLNHIFIICYFI